MFSPVNMPKICAGSSGIQIVNLYIYAKFSLKTLKGPGLYDLIPPERI